MSGKRLKERPRAESLRRRPLTHEPPALARHKLPSPFTSSCSATSQLTPKAGRVRLIERAAFVSLEMRETDIAQTTDRHDPLDGFPDQRQGKDQCGRSGGAPAPDAVADPWRSRKSFATRKGRAEGGQQINPRRRADRCQESFAQRFGGPAVDEQFHPCTPGLLEAGGNRVVHGGESLLPAGATFRFNGPLGGPTIFL